MRRVAVCVCTFKRDEPLRRLLTRLAEISDAATGYELALVVADDNPDLSARAVVESFASRFPLGAHHLVNGTQNISNGRNLVLAKACELADVAVMTDDDCLPEPQWIDALLATFDTTGADSVTGPMLADPAPGAAAWIEREGLFAALDSFPDHDVELGHGQTNNCLLSCAWLRANADHRFDPALGRLGGEDMAFFRTAVRRGMRSWFSAAARVHSIEPLDELTLRALLRTYYWLGNSDAVVNLRLGDASRLRLALRSARRILSAAAGPLQAVARRRPPHVRTALVLLARGAGGIAGAMGVRVRHH